MKVILKQDVEQVGQAGQVLDVADGFGRNYLVPRGLAILASTGSVAQLEHNKRIVDAKIARDRKAAGELAGRLGDVACKIAREAGEEDKLFGSVTARDIADALHDEGIDVDHKKIKLENPIKNLGIYHVDVKLGFDQIAKVKVWVVAK